jgi:hypothetical protein
MSIIDKFYEVIGFLATICLILAMFLVCIAIVVLYYGAIAYVILWLLRSFGVI